MRSKVNPVAIGMFVIGAAILATASVMVFGAAKFFAHTEKCISYFSESVNGLDVGAPLKFKGVKIGKVESRYAAPKDRRFQFAVRTLAKTANFRRNAGKAELSEHCHGNVVYRVRLPCKSRR